ncbi:MAG: cell division protein ZapA [Gammaproteobacteria bacterium]
MNKKKLVNIHVLNKELAVVCPEEEKADLLVAASFLDKRMREIRQTSKTTDLDRIAIIAALNIAHELLTLRQQSINNLADQLKTEKSSPKESMSNQDLFIDNSYL